MYKEQDNTTVLTTTEARQAKRVGLIWVLVISLALAFLGVFYLNFAA